MLWQNAKQTFNESKAIAIEKQLDKNFVVAENATELTEGEKVSSDTFLQSGSNAPSEESIKEISYQGAYRKELETSSHLSGRETV